MPRVYLYVSLCVLVSVLVCVAVFHFLYGGGGVRLYVLPVLSALATAGVMTLIFRKQLQGK
jgi:DMSO/TMAO reductase YedYZ heme-binding membrane subunit